MSVHGKVQYVTLDKKWYLEIAGRLHVTQGWKTTTTWTTIGLDCTLDWVTWKWEFFLFVLVLLLSMEDCAAKSMSVCVTWRWFPSLEIFPAGASALPSVSMTGHRSLLLAMQSTHKHAALSHSWVQHSRALWCREKTIRSVSEILNPSQQIPSQKCCVMPHLQILGVPLSSRARIEQVLHIPSDLYKMFLTPK